MDYRFMSRKQFLAYAATLGATLAFAPLAGCSAGSATTNANANAEANSAQVITTGPIAVVEDTNFSGVYIDMSLEEFANLGFQPGDSVDIALSNGKTYEDVPFYDGYYALTGDPVLVSYPGDIHPKFTRAQMGIWDECALGETDTITITLREASKYLDIEQAFSLRYSNDRADFASDAAFANFRACSGGQLRSNLVYRSASPVDNTYNRAPYANALVAAAGVQYGLDLSDTEETFAKFAAQDGDLCQYYIDLHAAGKVETIKLTANFGGDAFKTGVAGGLARMCDQPGPYLIHCVEGKDRTGIACMIVEVLAGASLDEVIDDYMITYDNYYHVNAASDPLCYAAIKSVNCDDSLMTLAGVDSLDDLTIEALRTGTERYLREGGLTDAQIAQMKATLTQ